MPYRLLNIDEPLKEGDEALGDDCIHWAPLPSIFLKCTYNPYFFKPIRRPVTENGDGTEAETIEEQDETLL